TAVYGNSTDYLGVQVNRDVYAGTQDGSAIGVYTHSVGATYARLEGNVVAKAQQGDAHGLEQRADGLVSDGVGGDIYAGSTYGYASGANIIVSGNAAVLSVLGNVIAKGYTAAFGAEITANGIDLRVYGDVYAGSTKGGANGVLAFSPDYNYVGVDGDVTA